MPTWDLVLAVVERYRAAMTDEATEHRPLLVPVPRYNPNPWVNGLGIAGFVAIVGGLILFLTPPPASDPDLSGTAVVNFPSMYEQYGLGLGAIILGAGLFTAWAMTAAREWRLQHPSGGR